MAKEDSYYFSNDDILGGLKAAIERGEPLKDAMMSFYNAGYAKEDIEEAARRYMMESSEQNVMSLPSKDTLKKPDNYIKKEETKEVVKEKLIPNEMPEPSKKLEVVKSLNPEPSKGFFGMFKSKPKSISDYNAIPKKKKKFEPMTIILVSLLLFLILVLGVVLLFKQELIDLFNKWLG